MLRWTLKNITLIILIFLFSNAGLLSQTSISGVVNRYYAINAIEYDSSFVILNNIPELNDSSRVLIIQMQGASIDESDSDSFGAINSYDQAGNYEFKTVCSVEGNKVFFENTFANSYEMNESVQLIYVPHYVSAVLTDSLTGLDWDGSTGGVLAIEVDGLFEMGEYDITMSSKGFRGAIGAQSGDDCSWLSNVVYSYYQNFDTEPWARGRKGEGITKVITGKECGIGPQANGGGGGNNHNGGGSGGANYGHGGRGGKRIPLGTFNCNAPAGISSIELIEGYNSDKIFLGGGGGAGHGNNPGTDGENGGNGGGIILIRANELLSNGGTIASNGENTFGSSTDGAAGGGAGGTVILEVNSFVGDLVIETIGGNGAGTINGGASNCNGPGGGGGGGALLTSMGGLPINVDLVQAGGNGGLVIATDQTNCTVGSQNDAEDGAVGGAFYNIVIPESQELSVGCQPICILPELPMLNGYEFDVCEGDEVEISIVSGDLHGASNWSWHAESCEGISIGQDSMLVVVPGDSIVYFVVAEGGCISDEEIPCISVTVNVYPIYESVGNVAICEGDQLLFNGDVISEEGQYVANLLSQYGCDSTIFLNVTVTSIDNGIIVDENTLSAVQQNASYQWIECDSNTGIVNATDVDFSPVVNGNYAVEVSDNNCTVVSDCILLTDIVGIENVYSSSEIIVYPNPTDGFIQVVLPVEFNLGNISLYNSLGQNIYNQIINSEELSIDLTQFSQGFYYLTFENESMKTYYHQIVKE